MRLIIEFAHTGFVPVTQENVQELYIAADQFNVDGIVQVCSNFLEEQLSPQNCIGIWWFTDVYYNPRLKHKAYLFMLNHFKEVAATSEEFLLLSAQDLAKIVENDKLNVKQENEVFEAIERWIAYAPEERREDIFLLLSEVSGWWTILLDSILDYLILTFMSLCRSGWLWWVQDTSWTRSLTTNWWSQLETVVPPQ